MKLELSSQIRWHAWCGENITADSTVTGSTRESLDEV